MKKLDYFLRGLNHGAFAYKEWIIECFGIVTLPPKPDTEIQYIQDLSPEEQLSYPMVYSDEPRRCTFEKYPCQLFQDQGQVVFVDPETAQWTVLEELAQPLKERGAFFKFKDRCQLPTRAIKNVYEPLETCYGNLLVNQIVLVFPFGEVIPFQVGEIDLRKVEDQISERLESVPEDENVPRDPNKIYVDVLEELYYEAAYSMSGWMQLGVPAATPYTITVDPGIRKLRAELLEKHIDELDQPAVIAKIMKQLIDADKNWQANDPDAGFLQPGKTFDVVRAKMFLMWGIEYDFTDRSKVVLIQRSLAEQWDITKLPEIANSLIDGSFNRGAMTALGGELAKVIMRFFMTTLITEDDCKTRLGRIKFIDESNQRDYQQMYIFDGQKEVLLDSETIKGYYGKQVLMRSPMYCQTKDGNFCVKCMGARFQDRRNSLAALATEVGARCLYIFMSRMHGVALKVERWDWKGSIR